MNCMDCFIYEMIFNRKRKPKLNTTEINFRDGAGGAGGPSYSFIEQWERDLGKEIKYKTATLSLSSFPFILLF